MMICLFIVDRSMLVILVVGIFATKSDIEKMSKKIEKMQHFDHPNMMSLIGVCLAPSEYESSSSGPSAREEEHNVHTKYVI